MRKTKTIPGKVKISAVNFKSILIWCRVVNYKGPKIAFKRFPIFIYFSRRYDSSVARSVHSLAFGWRCVGACRVFGSHQSQPHRYFRAASLLFLHRLLSMAALARSLFLFPGMVFINTLFWVPLMHKRKAFVRSENFIIYIFHIIFAPVSIPPKRWKEIGISN